MLPNLREAYSAVPGGAVTCSRGNDGAKSGSICNCSRQKAAAAKFVLLPLLLFPSRTVLNCDRSYHHDDTTSTGMKTNIFERYQCSAVASSVVLVASSFLKEKASAFFYRKEAP